MRSSGVSSIVGVEPDCVEGKAKGRLTGQTNVPPLSDGHELWVAAGMRFPFKSVGLRLRYGCSDTHRELLELLLLPVEGSHVEGVWASDQYASSWIQTLVWTQNT